MLKTFAKRHALSVALAVCIAFMMDYVFSFSHECWIVLSAFLVSQTTKGTPFKQGMLIFLAIVAAIVVAAILHEIISWSWIIDIMVSIIFMGSSYYAYYNRPLSSKTYFVIMIFAMTLLISLYSQVNTLDEISYHVFDAALGTFIGIACRFLVFPVQMDVEFSEGIMPTISALSEYSQILTEEKHDKQAMAAKRLQLENALLYLYPSWIYETGFNRGLRAGFRYFVINVEKVAEVFFAMDDIISRGIDHALWENLHASIEKAMEKNQELLAILSEHFTSGIVADTKSDFTSDVVELEAEVQRVIPDSIEMLVISPRLLLMTSFIREMKDLRELLLQLVMAIQGNTGTKKISSRRSRLKTGRNKLFREGPPNASVL